MKSIGAISSLFTLPSKEVWNIENGLNWAYNQTLRTDMPCGLCNALELADEYRMNYSSIMEASDKLIKDQLLKIGGTGLLISLGTLFNPVGIPVSMGISWMLQLRLINSLAYLGGYDLNSENVRTLAFVLLLGKRAEDFFLEKIIGAGALGVMKEGSKSIMKKLIPQFTSQITIKGGIKVVPILSGIVGTSVDVLMTHAIAKVAKQTFLKTTIECESFVRMEEERIKLLINMGIVDMYFCNEEKILILEIIKNSSIPDSKKDVFYRDIENSPSKLYSIDYTLFRKEKFYGVNLMTGLLSVALADGFIHPAEKIYLEEIAKELHISTDEFSSILETCHIKQD